MQAQLARFHSAPGIWALLCAALAWTACHSHPEGSGSGSVAADLAREPRQELVVRLGYQKIGPPFLLKSRAEGLERRLAQRGARPEWIEFQTGPALLEAMRAQAVDIGYAGETPPVFAQAGGVPLVYVALDPPAPEAEAIVVRADSPLRSIAELRGKRVALNRGSNVHYLLLRALESAALSLRDLEVVYLAPADARSAFESGRVDAWVIWDPFLAAAELAGARILRDGVGLVDNHLFYLVRREFAEREPELVRAVLEEYRGLSEWAAGHPEEASRLSANSSGIGYAALLKAERRHAYGLRPITAEVLQKQQVIADTFHRLELIPTAIHTDQAFLPRVAYAAN